MGKKQTIRLNESQLRRIVSEAVSEYGNSFHSYDELNESKIRRIVKESVRNVLNEGEGGYGNYSPEDLVAIAKAVVSVYGNGNLIPSNPNPSELAELLKYWEMEHGQTTDIYSAFKKMVTGGGW